MARKAKEHPSQDTLKQLFDYKDGHLYWRESRGGRSAGSRAGTMWGNGYYIQIGVNGQTYLAHRLIYILHHGDIPDDLLVSHIDKNTSNSRIENLRLVTYPESQFNRPGTKGYYWDESTGKWFAAIGINNEVIDLGCFDTEAEARAAYLEAKAKHHVIKTVTPAPPPRAAGGL